MMKYRFQLSHVFSFGIVLSLSVAQKLELPSFIHPCDNFGSECLINAANEAIPGFSKGIPEVGIRPTDPYEVKPVTFQIGTLDIKFGPGTLTGLKNCRADKIAMKLDERKVTIAAHCNATVSGPYSTSGQLIIIPIKGEGDANIKITNLRIKVTLPFDLKKESDQKHFFIPKDNFKFKYEMDNAHFKLTNLFNGNEQLAEVVLLFLNQNWKEIIEEFGGPIIKHSVEESIENIGRLFVKYPVEDLLKVDLEKELAAMANKG